jgi:DNA-binding HxlR family transcriptional regulator
MQTKEQTKAARAVATVRRQIRSMKPTRTEAWLDDRLAELEDAQLVARLSRNAGFRG